MTDVVIMRSVFPATAWKSGFADTLIQLCPDMNPDAADEVADAEVLRARQQEPAQAARRWAKARGQALPVATPSVRAAQQQTAAPPLQRAGR